MVLDTPGVNGEGADLLWVSCPLVDDSNLEFRVWEVF